MNDTITLTGLVATTPKRLVTSEDLNVTSFRLAATQRRFDSETQKWVDGDTNWYTITAFRDLAVNVIGSIVKGQRILVTGRLRVRDWATDDKSGTNVEVEAETLGHDLRWGDAQFTHHTHAAQEPTAEAPAEEPTTV
jgi:single-strand DNA-binding protein